jgi:uncharacterized protein (TIGR03083 family)
VTGEGDSSTDRSFIDCLEDTWAHLSSLTHALDESEWHAPTECPGWDVAAHVAHVAGTEATLLGRPAPPSAPPGPHVRNRLGEMNEAWVQHWRGRPTAELVAELDEVTAARLSALRAMSDEELARPGWSPIGEVPYATFMGIRVMDCWVHEQDIRQATGRPWRFDGPAAPAAIERLMSSLGFVVGKRVAPGEGCSVALVVSVDGHQPWEATYTIVGGRAVPSDPGTDPVARVGLGGETWVRLATGRLTGGDALAAGLVHLDGDRSIGERIVDNLAHIP